MANISDVSVDEETLKRTLDFRPVLAMVVSLQHYSALMLMGLVCNEDGVVFLRGGDCQRCCLEIRCHKVE